MRGNASRYTVAIMAAFVINLACCSFVWAGETSDTVSLSVKPEKCIALHKGQTCYQHLTFTFSGLGNNQYCLYQIPITKPLHCWGNSGKSSYRQQFESNQSEVYQIRRPNSAKVLSEVKVRLATVYKQSKKSYSGWRLF